MFYTETMPPLNSWLDELYRTTRISFFDLVSIPLVDREKVMAPRKILFQLFFRPFSPSPKLSLWLFISVVGARVWALLKTTHSNRQSHHSFWQQTPSRPSETVLSVFRTPPPKRKASAYEAVGANRSCTDLEHVCPPAILRLLVPSACKPSARAVTLTACSILS